MGQQMYSPPAMDKPKSSYKGCLIGCLVAFLLMIIAIAAVSYMAYSGITGMMDAVLDDEPMEITSMESTEEEQEMALEQFETFVAAAEAGEAQTLELSGRDLNNLIRAKAGNEEFDIGEYVYLDIQDSELMGEISLPLGEIMPDVGFLANKFVNGQATFSINMENERLSVYIEELTVKGKPIPEEFMTQFRTENLAKEANKDPEMSEWMEYIESIEIIGDKAVITSKAK